MSQAAVDYVQACTHPQVKGGTRALLEAIARLIPEGQTTTPVIGMEELAVQARLNRRTVLRLVPELVDLGAITVVDGGPGRPARYAIGERPLVEPTLPLRADLRPAPDRRHDSTPDLFDPPVIVDNLRQIVTGVTGGNLRQIVTGWAVSLVYLRQIVTGCLRNLRQIVTGALRLGLGGTRARGTYTFKNVHTPLADEPSAPEKPDAGPHAVPDPPPRCRWFPRTHAWCEGPLHVPHVPRVLHLDFLEHWPKLPGETTAELERRLVAFYATRAAAYPPDRPILDKDDFQFWRREKREYLAESADVAPKARAPTDRAPRDVYAEAEEQARQRRRR